MPPRASCTPIAWRRAGNWRGRKIGFTNRTIWERYGVHEPMWGAVLIGRSSVLQENKAHRAACRACATAHRAGDLFSV
jgi:2-keto-4-pentenoate hydratase